MYGSRDAGFFGYSHFTGGFAGGQAEYVRVPFGEVNCLVVPDEIKDEQALYLSDVLPTSYHAVVDTGVKKGDVVGVWVSQDWPASHPNGSDSALCFRDWGPSGSVWPSGLSSKEHPASSGSTRFPTVLPERKRWA